MVAILLVIGLTAAESRASQDVVRAIIQRGIEAQGGEAQIAKLSQPWRAKVRGKAGALDIEGEILQQSETVCRISTVLRVGPVPLEVVVVTNGDKAWKRIAGFTSEVSGKDFAEMQDGGYRHRVRNLVPLLHEHGFQLTLLPEATVSNRPAVGIRIQSKGHRDVDLYFENDSGLVVKTESRFYPSGKSEAVLENVLSDFRDFDGLKFATKYTKYESHKLTSIEEYVDLEFGADIDSRAFEKP